MDIPQRASLLKQVTDILRQNIQAGVWVKSMPAERVIADELQVSRPTVRAALRVLQSEKLIQISQGRSTRIIKHLRTTTPTKSVTLLTPEPLHAITGADHLVANELRRHLQNASYRLKLQYDGRLRDRDPRTILEKMIVQSKNSVWVLHLQTASVQRFFADRGLKTLVFGSTYENIELPSFDIDFRSVCRHAAGKFLGMGHRRIALVTPETGLAGDVAGKEGFREAFEISSHADAKPLIISHRQTVSSLCSALGAALKQPAPPTGLLVSHPADVLTTLTYLQMSGIRVPEDISLVSRGYAEYLECVVPPVACYRVDWEQYARSFSHAVVQLAETGALAKRSTLIEPKFHKGNTLEKVSERK